MQGKQASRFFTQHSKLLLKQTNYKMILLRNPKIFRMICFLPTILHLTPLKWDHKNLHMGFRNDFKFVKIRVRILKFQTFMYFLFPIQGIVCFYLYPTMFILSFTDTIIYYFAIFGLFTMLVTHNNSVKKASSQCLYINGIIQTSKYVAKICTDLHSVLENSWVKKLDFLFAILLPPNIVLVPFIYVFAFHWYSPCKPSLLGFFLLPECYTNGERFYISNILIKTVICVVNTWTWVVSCLCATYCISGFLVLCVLNFAGFLQAMEQMCRDEHSIEDMYTNGLFFRRIQVLGCMCNEVQQSDLLPSIIITGIIETTIGITATCWVDWTPENTPGLVFFVILVLDTILLLLICFGVMAQIYQEYQDFLDRVTKRRMVSTRTKKRMCYKWKERFYLSCTPVKFKFGQLNFIERLTPLNCILFSIDQSASLLLLGKDYR